MQAQKKVYFQQKARVNANMRLFESVNRIKSISHYTLTIPTAIAFHQYVNNWSDS